MPMSEEVMVVAKVPIQRIAEDIRSRYSLEGDLFDAKLEGDILVLSFRRALGQELQQPEMKQPNSPSESKTRVTITELKTTPEIEVKKTVRRRRKSRRNRMKTRGWQVVGKIVNSKGQTGMVYKPFVEALFGKQLTPAQQRAAVASILRSNGNDPTDASIEYFLTNTLEYLSQVNRPEGGS